MKCFVVSIVSVLALLASSKQVSGQEYQVIDTGLVTYGTYDRPIVINNFGMIAGYARIPSGGLQGILFRGAPGQSYEYLNRVSDGQYITTSNSSSFVDFSDNGTVLGTLGSQGPCVWYLGEQYGEALYPLWYESEGGNLSDAQSRSKMQDINANDEIVGMAYTGITFHPV